MRLSLIALAGLLAAGAGGTQALAQTDPLSADLRCLMMGMAMTNVPDPKVRTSGLVTIYYYLGRLDPSLPGPQLETRIRTEARAMTPDKAKADAQRCAAQMTARQAALQATAKRLAPPPAAKGPPPKR